MGWGWYGGWGPWRGRFGGRGRGWCWWYPYYGYGYGYEYPYESYGYPYDPIEPYHPESELRSLEAYRQRIEEELKEIKRRIDELKRSTE